ncbi:14705_t:CDS:1 [Funneliformis mosseae]|uniref:14705_t:CDS:1 n=1 Tax=Funneliformis mosseae TaxID=27381 RepID=A0A9N8YR02_FUNMO|nr:14705_t:CDS:1 [Funneliformis mosseae]
MNGIGVLLAADLLHLDKLIDPLQEQFKRKTKWLKKNLSVIFPLISQQPKLTTLKEVCLTFILSNPMLIFSINNMGEDIIYDILGMNELKYEESEYWDYIIEWGMLNYPTLFSEEFKLHLKERIQTGKTIELNDEQLDALRNTLQRLLTRIRFDQMSSKMFYFKVGPFSRILPDNLYINLLRYHFEQKEKPKFPTSEDIRRGPIQSKIITSKHAAIITDWIEASDLDYFKRNPEELTDRVEFKLLYDSELNGLTSKAFHSRCDGFASTVVVIKYDNDIIVGGYNPAYWKSESKKTSFWMQSGKSFIFSFRKNHESILSKINNDEKEYVKELFISPNLGPIFGESDLGLTFKRDRKNRDICQCICRRNNYSRSILPPELEQRKDWSIKKFEVFQIININPNISNCLNQNSVKFVPLNKLTNFTRLQLPIDKIKQEILLDRGDDIAFFHVREGRQEDSNLGKEGKMMGDKTTVKRVVIKELENLQVKRIRKCDKVISHINLKKIKIESYKEREQSDYEVSESE